MSENNKRQMLKKAILRIAKSRYTDLGKTKKTEFSRQYRPLGRIQSKSDSGQRARYRSLYKDYLSGNDSARTTIENDIYAKLNNRPDSAKVHVPNTNFYFQYTLSEHAQFRMDERGIDHKLAKDVVKRGLRELYDAQGTPDERKILARMRSNSHYRVEVGGHHKVGGRIRIMSQQPENIEGVPSVVFQMSVHTLFFRTYLDDSSEVIDEIDCIDLIERDGSTHVVPIRMASFKNRKAFVRDLNTKQRRLLSPQHNEQNILKELDALLTEHINTISLDLPDGEFNYLERGSKKNPPLVVNVGGLTFSLEATWDTFGGVASNIRGQVYEIDNPAQRYRNNCITSLTNNSKYQIK